MNLKVKIQRNSNISINEQIKIQLRWYIAKGILLPGEKLPSIREMSAFLNVNRNTIMKAYRELEEEGFVETQKSLGTFVCKNIRVSNQNMQDLYILLMNALHDSIERGFTIDDFLSAAQAIYLNEKNKDIKIKALFIECNVHAMNNFVKQLEDELNIEVVGALIQELEEGKFSQTAIEEFNLIITTVGHYPKVKSLLNNMNNIYGINVGPYLDVVKELIKYENDINIGIVCITESGAAGLKESLIALGIKTSRIITSSIRDESKLKEVMDHSDVLVISKFALAERGELFKKIHKNIIEYKNVLDKSSINMLKEVILKNEDMI